MLDNRDARGGTSMTALTALARGGGCGCKLGRTALMDALRMLPQPHDPNVLAGFGGAEDAAAYRVSDDLAVVASVDFFTAVVDDPATFGAIAAVNALSDLHAMGATPAFALGVAAFPDAGDTAPLAAIMRGAADAALRDGCVVLGGHTIDDPEPKYGLAVVGFAHPERLLTNARGRAGDALVLTKALGTGVILTAAKFGAAVPGPMRGALDSMLRSNRDAAAAALAAGVVCATDVTGFGLAGHLSELAGASGVGARISASAVPLLPGARTLAQEGVITGGATRNRAFPGLRLDIDEEVPDALVDLLHDPQTSGGLLLAVPPAVADALRRELAERDVPHWEIGHLVTGTPGVIEVTP